MKETYKQAQARLLKAMADAGHTVKTGLKVPYALVDGKMWRVEFHPQAVYFGRNGGPMHSMWLDIRDMSYSTFGGSVSRAITVASKEG